MIYTSEYESPLGTITLACDEQALVGLWFNGQKYFGSTLPRDAAPGEHPLFGEARRWLDIYFSGRQPDFLPPLRYDSTPFRRVICDIMLAIPYGSTMTYGTIATAAGRGQNVRPGGGRSGGAQPHFPHDPLSPGGGGQREPHRLWRRHPTQGSAAGAGRDRYERIFRTEEGHGALIGLRP